jgi:hypothetical protein
MTGDELRHGEPGSSRSVRFDKHIWPPDEKHWPRGLQVIIYDDGRVKVGAPHATAKVVDVSNYRKGSTDSAGFVIVHFQAVASDGPVDRYTAGELREQAEAYLEWRRGDHAEKTVATDKNKIELFLDWLENQES